MTQQNKSLPSFVKLTRLNGENIYVRSDLIDLEQTKDGFKGSQVKLTTEAHPMIAYKGFLDVQEKRQQVEEALSKPITTKTSLIFERSMSGMEAIVGGSITDLVSEGKDHMGRKRFSLHFSSDRKVEETYKNPMEDERNILRSAKIYRLTPPTPKEPT
jgi:hypothetical protein